MQVKMTMDMMEKGEMLNVSASDPGFFKDIEAWSKRTKNTLVSLKKENGLIKASIIKGFEDNEVAVSKDNTQL
ncbi:sulfurtransferase TusA family protein, partial [Enterococcus faecium]